MLSQVQPTIGPDRISQAFKALGILEGLAAPSRDLDPTVLGDTIA